MKKAIIFDLDGTLLHTLPDIRDAINHALSECGYDYSFDLEGTKTLIGDGADMLVRRALKEKGEDEEAFLQLKKAYMPKYRLYQGNTTAPFEGMSETLLALKKRGMRLFIASNKPHALAKAIIAKCFPEGLFESVAGHQEGDPVKPNPIQVQRIFKNYAISPADCVYVGDSVVDVQTAENAHIPCGICLWGYGKYTEEVLARCAYVFRKPEDLLTILK
jgi:phosphoglycolate phosphatase